MPFPLVALLAAGQVVGGLLAQKGPRPNWTIPGAATEALSMARQQAAGTRPGNQQAIDQIQRNASSQVSTINRTAGSGSQALAAIGRVEAMTNNQASQNNVLNANYQFNAKQNLQRVLGTYAGLQREQFVQNVMEPYQQRVSTKASLISSGLQNGFGALNQFAQNDMLSKIYGVDNKGGGGLGELFKSIFRRRNSVVGGSGGGVDYNSSFLPPGHDVI